MMDVTIEEYLEYVSHLMKQAEEAGFTYEDSLENDQTSR